MTDRIKSENTWRNDNVVIAIKQKACESTSNKILRGIACSNEKCCVCTFMERTHFVQIIR